MYVCPTCNKELKTKRTLAAHIEKCNPAEAEAETEALELVPPAGETADALDSVKYRCIECNHEPITKGQETCPNCGITLDWTALNG
ncbi:hypothetical protein ACFLYS_01715 [Chloroflexota bacterium]